MTRPLFALAWEIECGKYIKQHSEAKVIFNGDGADELMGGYISLCPDNDEFHNETLRLLSDISKFDVLRSDKSISSHGLEPRTPFLDKEFTKFYISIPIEYRNHNQYGNFEKYLIRKSFEIFLSRITSEVLWRKKEAFSDGVSSKKRSVNNTENEIVVNISSQEIYKHNKPDTCEKQCIEQYSTNIIRNVMN